MPFPPSERIEFAKTADEGIVTPAGMSPRREGHAASGIDLDRDAQLGRYRGVEIDLPSG